MIVENTESIESAITLTAHSTDSDNIAHMEHYVIFYWLASERLNGYDQRGYCLLVTRFLADSEDVYPVCDLIPYERLYSSYFSRELLFELCE